MTAQSNGKDLLPRELPRGSDLIGEGRRIAATFAMGRSLLCREHGVASEAEYKRKMVAEGRIMTCMNFGPPSWPEGG